MNTMIKYFFFILILLLLFSCDGQKNKPITDVLYFDTIHSSVSEPFFRDSILIMYYDKDSILIKNYYNGHYYQNVYFNREDNFFEKRYVTNLPEDIFEVDTILSFSKKDTTFIYKSNRDDFIVTLIDLSLFNSHYIIQGENNNYTLIKQSLVDSTYKEIFFYDKNYHIYKYVNTWKDNKCVYVKKE